MLKNIQSPTNPLIKEIVSLHSQKGRDKSGLFLLEGPNLLAEAIKDKLAVQFIAINEKHALGNEYDSYNISKYIFSELCFKKISSTSTPTNIIAVAKKVSFSLSNIIENNEKTFSPLLILENIQDPGNLGTIIRTAVAASISGIILTGNCVDIFNPKVVRSSAGNLWKIPIVECNEKENLVTFLKDNSFNLVLTEINATKNYYDYIFNKKNAIVFGSEGSGISKFFMDKSADKIKIPISTKVESLNVASSVAIILFELNRQKVFKNE